MRINHDNKQVVEKGGLSWNNKNACVGIVSSIRTKHFNVRGGILPFKTCDVSRLSLVTFFIATRFGEFRHPLN